MAEKERWWKYAVIRGTGIPADMNGKWYDMDEMSTAFIQPTSNSVKFVPTNMWEQRDDGEVAVVYILEGFKR